MTHTKQTQKDLIINSGLEQQKLKLLLDNFKTTYSESKTDYANLPNWWLNDELEHSSLHYLHELCVKHENNAIKIYAKTEKYHIDFCLGDDVKTIRLNKNLSKFDNTGWDSIPFDVIEPIDSNKQMVIIDPVVLGFGEVLNLANIFNGGHFYGSLRNDDTDLVMEGLINNLLFSYEDLTPENKIGVDILCKAFDIQVIKDVKVETTILPFG